MGSRQAAADHSPERKISMRVWIQLVSMQESYNSGLKIDIYFPLI